MGDVIYMKDFLLKKGRTNHPILRQEMKDEVCCGNCRHWNTPNNEKGQCTHSKNSLLGFTVITSFHQGNDCKEFMKDDVE